MMEVGGVRVMTWGVEKVLEKEKKGGGVEWDNDDDDNKEGRGIGNIISLFGNTLLWEVVSLSSAHFIHGYFDMDLP